MSVTDPHSDLNIHLLDLYFSCKRKGTWARILHLRGLCIDQITDIQGFLGSGKAQTIILKGIIKIR